MPARHGDAGGAPALLGNSQGGALTTRLTAWCPTRAQDGTLPAGICSYRDYEAFTSCSCIEQCRCAAALRCNRRLSSPQPPAPPSHRRRFASDGIGEANSPFCFERPGPPEEQTCVFPEPDEPGVKFFDRFAHLHPARQRSVPACDSAACAIAERLRLNGRDRGANAAGLCCCKAVMASRKSSALTDQAPAPPLLSAAEKVQIARVHPRRRPDPDRREMPFTEWYREVADRAWDGWATQARGRHPERNLL